MMPPRVRTVVLRLRPSMRRLSPLHARSISARLLAVGVALGLLACERPMLVTDGASAAPALTESASTESALTESASTESASSAPSPVRPVVDLHVDTITQLLETGNDVRSGSRLEASLDAMDAGGVGLVVEAVWIPRANLAPDPTRYALERLERLHALLNAHPRRWKLITRAQDLDDVPAAGPIGVVLALEGGQAIHELADVARFYARGVRMVGLAWSFSNQLCGSSGDLPPPGRGLSPLGLEVVGELNRLGMAIDVSHASDRCLEDVLQASRAPLLASHSNARAVLDVPRNLSDAHLRALSARGGLVGVMFHAPFVAARNAGLEQVVDHILHMNRVMGPGHVGLGSDFDGRIQSVSDLKSSRDFPRLERALRARGLTSTEVEDILGNNARAYLKRALTPVPQSQP